MPRLWKPTLLIRFFILLGMFVGILLIFKKFELKPEVRRNTNVKHTHAKDDGYNKMLGSSYQKKINGVFSAKTFPPGKPQQTIRHGDNVISYREGDKKDKWHRKSGKTRPKKLWKKNVDTKQYEHGPLPPKEKILAHKGKLPATVVTGNSRDWTQKTRFTTRKPKYKEPRTPNETHLDNKHAKKTETNKGNLVKWPIDKNTDKNTGRKTYLPNVKTTNTLKTKMKDKKWKSDWNKKEHTEKTVKKGKGGGNAVFTTKTYVKKGKAGNYKIITSRRIPLTKGNGSYQRKGK